MIIKITTDEMDNTIITIYCDGLTMDAATITPPMLKALKAYLAEKGE